MKSLNNKQILMWQQLYKFKTENNAGICRGFKWKNKEHREFLKPFLTAELIHKDSFKFCDVVILTNKGKEKFEELLKAL